MECHNSALLWISCRAYENVVLINYVYDVYSITFKLMDYRPICKVSASKIMGTKVFGRKVKKVEIQNRKDNKKVRKFESRTFVIKSFELNLK